MFHFVVVARTALLPSFTPTNARTRYACVNSFILPLLTRLNTQRQPPQRGMTATQSPKHVVICTIGQLLCYHLDQSRWLLRWTCCLLWRMNSLFARFARVTRLFKSKFIPYIYTYMHRPPRPPDLPRLSSHKHRMSSTMFVVPPTFPSTHLFFLR